MLLQHCSLKSRGCHPLIASSNARDRSVPWLRGSTLGMLRNYPGLAPFFGTCKKGRAAIVALGGRQCGAGYKLSTAQLRDGFCAWMQSTSFSKNIPGKEAGIRFSQLTKVPRALPDSVAVAGLHVLPLKKGDNPQTTLASTRSGTSFGFLPVLC